MRRFAGDRLASLNASLEEAEVQCSCSEAARCIRAHEFYDGKFDWDRAERMSLVKKRLEYWLPGSKSAVWRFKNFRKVIGQNCAFLSSLRAAEGFATPKRTVKSMPLLQASPEDQIVPKYYLPRTNFQEMMGIGEPQFVTMGGLFYQVIMLVCCLW